MHLYSPWPYPCSPETQMRRTSLDHTFRRVLPSALMWAALFSYLEVLRDHRSAYWTGDGVTYWLGMGAGLVAYAAVLVLVTLPLAFSLHKRLACSSSIAVFASAVVPALVIWTILWRHWPEDHRLESAAIYTLILGLAVLWSVVCSGDRISPLSFSLLATSVFAGATGAAAAAADLLFLDAARTKWVTLISVACGGLCGLLIAVGYLLRRRTVTVSGAAAVPTLGLAALLFVAAQAQPTRPLGPNVLLITSDALRADYCSLYDGPVPTPLLDQMGDEGVVFERSYALAPWTIPSMFAMFA